MRVYALGESARKAPEFAQSVAPGAYPGAKDNGPADWFDGDGKPVTFRVVYTRGRADVPDALGRLMIAQGLAARTPLILPSRKFAA